MISDFTTAALRELFIRFFFSVLGFFEKTNTLKHYENIVIHYSSVTRSLFCVIVYVRVVLKRIVLVTGVSTNRKEVIFSVK